MNYHRIYMALIHGGNVPRKAKKLFLGNKVKRYRLRALLKSVKVLKPAKTMFESPVIEPGLFCPKCGCTESKGTGNMVEYPDHWEYFYCLRCTFKVGYIDNSPFRHCLEYAGHNYELN